MQWTARDGNFLVCFSGKTSTKEEGESLRGERGRIKFIGFVFERGQVVGSWKGRRMTNMMLAGDGYGSRNTQLVGKIQAIPKCGNFKAGNLNTKMVWRRLATSGSYWEDQGKERKRKIKSWIREGFKRAG